MPRLAPILLERELQTELSLEGIQCSARLIRSGRALVALVVNEVLGVGDVEHFPEDLDALAFLDREVLRRSQIESEVLVTATGVETNSRSARRAAAIIEVRRTRRDVVRRGSVVSHDSAKLNTERKVVQRIRRDPVTHVV